MVKKNQDLDSITKTAGWFHHKNDEYEKHGMCGVFLTVFQGQFIIFYYIYIYHANTKKTRKLVRIDPKLNIK